MRKLDRLSRRVGVGNNNYVDDRIQSVWKEYEEVLMSFCWPSWMSLYFKLFKKQFIVGKMLGCFSRKCSRSIKPIVRHLELRPVIAYCGEYYSDFPSFVAYSLNIRKVLWCNFFIPKIYLVVSNKFFYSSFYFFLSFLTVSFSIF